MCSCIAVLCAGTSLPPRARARINISTDIFPDTSPPRSPTCLSTPPKDMPQLSTSATSTQRKRAAASMEGAVTMRCCLIPNIPANEDAGAQLSDGDRQKVRCANASRMGPCGASGALPQEPPEGGCHPPSHRAFARLSAPDLLIPPSAPPCLAEGPGCHLQPVPSGLELCAQPGGFGASQLDRTTAARYGLQHRP